MTRKERINKITYSDAIAILRKHLPETAKKLSFGQSDSTVKSEVRRFLRFHKLTPKEALK